MECTRNINYKHCGLRHNQVICYKFNNSMKKDKNPETKTDQAKSKDEIVSIVSHTGKSEVFFNIFVL